ncbi:MAG: hypothetical protein JWO04_827 [Gammaproteobacteria bacterium]|nr:hypothetical protein [Gammaproteobacteria bacterium]
MNRNRLTHGYSLLPVFALLGNAVFAGPPKYDVTELAGLGGTSSSANSINNRGWISGSSNPSGNLNALATLWVYGSPVSLGTLGGTDSSVAWPVKNDRGLIVGISELPVADPLGNNFSCWPFFAAGTPTGRICRGFRWPNGEMSTLSPFPGGYSSYATAANNRGEVVGWAENGVHDPSCDPAFQILQFRATIWHADGTMQELPPLPGDSTSAARAINDRGQVVGISGDCGVAVGSVSAKHAVLRDHGVPMDLGNLGGDAWNTPTAINNRGVVVGFANIARGVARTFEAFIWTRTTGMKSLGKLPGDLRSEATGINEHGEVVGLSRGGPYVFRAVVWRHEKLIDLNALTAPGSPFLLIAGDINDDGTIVGQAFHPDTQASPAFMATPRSEQESEEPGNVQEIQTP